MAGMSGFSRKRRRLRAEGATFCAHRTARTLLHERNMKTIHVARAGLFVVVLGCSSTLVSPDAGTPGSAGTSGREIGAAGTTGWEIGAAGTIGSQEYGCAGFLGSYAGAGGDTGAGGTSGMADPPGSCGSVTTLAECDARNDCHPVFVDHQNCACAALGCCAMFSRCAVGEHATCAGAAECTAVPNRPHCEGPYIVGFVAIDGQPRYGNGYEGCVRASDCPGPTGAGGTIGAAGTSGTAGTNGAAGGTGAASN